MGICAGQPGGADSARPSPMVCLHLLIRHTGGWLVRSDHHARRAHDVLRRAVRPHVRRPRLGPAPVVQDQGTAFTTMKHLAETQARLKETTTMVARIATDLVDRIRALTIDINAVEAELDDRTAAIAPTLREVHGVAAVSAAKFIGVVAGIERFRSRHAFARHNGTAPTPVWSGNNERYRLSRAGNRQLNAALHRVALTQARSHPQARDYLDQRLKAGATRKEAMRSLKRRLSDVVYRAMLADAATQKRTRTLAA